MPASDDHSLTGADDVTLDAAGGRSPGTRDRLILENINEGFFTLDENLIFTYFNRAAEHLLGRAREEVLGRGLTEAFPEAAGSVFEEQYTDAITSRRALSFEVWFGRPPYENWYEVRVHPDRGGIAVFFLVTTQRRRAMEKLEYQNQLLKIQQDTSPDGLLVLDRQFNLLSHNRRFVEMFAPPESILESGDGWAALTLVCSRLNDGDRLTERFRRMMDHWEENQDWETYQHADGRTLELYSRGLTEPSGDHLGRIWFFRDATDRVQAEASLRESESRFRQLAEHIEQVFWLRTPHQMLYISPAYEKVWGRSTASLYENPQSFIDAVHPEDRERVVRALGSHEYQTSLGFDEEYRVVRPDGTIRWVRARAFPVPTEEGRPQRSAGLAEDITSWKNLEQRLREALAQLARAQEMAQVGSWEWDITGDRITWSDEVYRIFGLDPTRFPADFASYINGIHPEDREEVRQSLNRALAEKRSFQVEHRVLRPDGTIREVVGLGEIHVDSAGNPSRLFGVVQDLTDRKRTEQRIRESEARLQAILDTAVEGIITIDQSGAIETVNHTVERLFGHEPSQMVGQNVKMLMPEPYRGHHDEYIRNYLETGQKKIIGIGREVVGLRKDGGTFPVELSVSEVRLAHRRIFTGIIRDVTQRKEMEDELRRLASTDPLTGINNRRQFLVLTEQEHKRATRYQAPLSMLMLDIDHFKSINDTHGHDFGDEVLKAFSRVVSEQLRESDILGRVGGEEFAVTLVECDLSEADLAAERIREAVAEQAVPHAERGPVSFTVSIGAARLQPDEDVSSVMRRADAALYEAKRRGRNQVALSN